MSGGSRRRWLVPALLAAPAVLYFVAFMVVPLGQLGWSSLHGHTNNDMVTSQWTLSNYIDLIADPFYRDVYLRTLKIGLLTTLICAVIGFPFAICVVRARGAARTALTLVLLSPLLVSMVIRAYGWVIILGREGPVADLGAPFGLDAPLLYTETAVVIGMVHVMVAYMVLSIVTSLERIDPAVLTAAASLGAGPVRTFLRVTLPLAMPGMLAGSVIVFSLTVSSFVTPSILGGSRVKLVPYFVYEQAKTVLNWPFAAALGLSLMALTIVLLLLASGALRRTSGMRSLAIH